MEWCLDGGGENLERQIGKLALNGTEASFGQMENFWKYVWCEIHSNENRTEPHCLKMVKMGNFIYECSVP